MKAVAAAVILIAAVAVGFLAGVYHSLPKMRVADL